MLLATLALLALSPLVLFVCCILICTGEREVFYKQSRVGHHGRPFNVYKFATMLKDSPNLGAGTVTLKDDERVLPFGRFLRHTKINELPQLFNVINGSMSLIGPRPQTPRCFEAYPQNVKSRITSVRPGISGVGSIIFRGEEELLQDQFESERFYDHVIMPYKGALELWYIDNKGLPIYLQCILLTLWSVIFPASKLPMRLLKGLPTPPPELRAIWSN